MIKLAILRFIALSALNALAGLLNYPLAPIAVLFQKDGWLPRRLWWLQTPDYSLDGDEGWKEKHPGMPTYLKRVLWLYRNSMYGFSISVLGAPVKEGFIYRSWGDEQTGNRPLHNGWVFRRVDNWDGPVVWQLYWVQTWNSTMCIRVNLGWKLWKNPKAGDRPQLVLSANPCMGYSIKRG